MKRLRVGFLLFVFAFSGTVLAAEKPNHIAVLGGAVTGSTGPYASDFFTGLSAGSQLNFNGEVRFAPRSRFSGGVSVFAPYGLQGGSELRVTFTEFTYFDGNGNPVKVVAAPGEDLAHYDLKTEGRIKTAVVGSGYVNFVNRRSFQIFAAGDGGIGSAAKTYSATTWVDPRIRDYFQYEIGGTTTADHRYPIYGARGGVNGYADLGKHVSLVVSGSVGYRRDFRRGIVALLNVGVVF